MTFCQGMATRHSAAHGRFRSLRVAFSCDRCTDTRSPYEVAQRKSGFRSQSAFMRGAKPYRHTTAQYICEGGRAGLLTAGSQGSLTASGNVMARPFPNTGTVDRLAVSLAHLHLHSPRRLLGPTPAHGHHYSRSADESSSEPFWPPAISSHAVVPDFCAPASPLRLESVHS
ncbi:hypothetical protein N658DRAFT_248030 [Parathielavia hyrcaniae]|uniref:Uncharacterized protein n=1 Tax=Parathielavia hyrcaniae TaxID=113614 RepID=A0AAN6Q625_9PEZI|nr:hypothetical protein N658DRAFT_248030 [Parathielavia hyrcaniae]